MSVLHCLKGSFERQPSRLTVVLLARKIHSWAGLVRHLHHVLDEGAGGVLPTERTDQRSWDVRPISLTPCIGRKRAPEQGNGLPTVPTLKSGVYALMLRLVALYPDMEHVSPLGHKPPSIVLKVAEC